MTLNIPRHKNISIQILKDIYADTSISSFLGFKGGTAAYLFYDLPRFSVDLDFDYVGSKKDLESARKNMEQIFSGLGLEIKDKSRKVPQYFLKYPALEGGRNTIKVDVTFPAPKANAYGAQRLAEIDRIARCQTIETMFANKLVALIDRWEKKESIAGRDLYDIHHFFLQGFSYSKAVIKERRKTSVKTFFKKLAEFVEKKVTDKVINQDLNLLLPPDKFQKTRKTIKRETLMFLKDEIGRR